MWLYECYFLNWNRGVKTPRRREYIEKKEQKLEKLTTEARA